MVGSKPVLYLISVIPLALVTLGCDSQGSDPDPGLVVAFGDNAPAVLEQTIVEGGERVDVEIGLLNSGNCVLAYTVEWSTVDGLNWLFVDVNSGTMAVGITMPMTVSFDVQGPPMLPPGTYTGSIVIEGECLLNGMPVGNPIVIAVNMTVTPLIGAMEIDAERLGQDITVLDDIWEPMPAQGAPQPRIGVTGVWTGWRMAVWGGFNSATTDSGGLYEPYTDTWTATAALDAPSPRRGHSAVWTGTEMWIMGGSPDAGIPSTFLDDGGLYDPMTNSWSPSPNHGGVFTARMDHTALWTGARLILWGGRGTSGLLDTGAIGSLTAGWTAISTLDTPAPRAGHSAVWTGSRMIVWGGGNSSDPYYNSGGIFDPATNSWQATALSGAPTGRAHHTAVWTGREMIVWGGQTQDSTPLNDGGIFDPFTNQWHAMTTDGAPSLLDHVAVWTGDRMLVWGINDITEPPPEAGGVYDPAVDAWSLMTTDQAPVNQFDPAFAWTGRELLVWGGWYFSNALETVTPGEGGGYH